MIQLMLFGGKFATVFYKNYLNMKWPLQIDRYLFLWKEHRQTFKLLELSKARSFFCFLFVVFWFNIYLILLSTTIVCVCVWVFCLFFFMKEGRWDGKNCALNKCKKLQREGLKERIKRWNRSRKVEQEKLTSRWIVVEKKENSPHARWIVVKMRQKPKLCLY